jgi:hypothetical protein
VVEEVVAQKLLEMCLSHGLQSTGRTQTRQLLATTTGKLVLPAKLRELCFEKPLESDVGCVNACSHCAMHTVVCVLCVVAVAALEVVPAGTCDLALLRGTGTVMQRSNVIDIHVHSIYA